ncbi:hypothetical protein BJV74DRAFT_798107 [Russula compacta]|nr:hypothetical protein BJV74DRAFT_798107 [Russula compacta]
MSVSRQPVLPRAHGQMLLCSPISTLPDELLVEIFDFCRRDNEYVWSYRREWYKLLHVCRRWRCVMLSSPSRLNLRLLFKYRIPLARMLTDSPPLPLIVTFGFYGHYKDSILLALQHHDRLCSISLRELGSKQLNLLTALDKVFLSLESLSLSTKYSDTEVGVLPNDFVAPRLRVLHLRSIALSTESLLLTNATSLVSLRLECLPVSDFFSPEYLVERISSMPRLENLSISLLHFPLPRLEMEFQHVPNPRVVLPSLERLIFRGPSNYLERLLARINTPLLIDLRVKFTGGRTLIVPRLSEFLRMQNLNFHTVEVSFSSTFIAITYHSGQPLAALPYFLFGTRDPDGGQWSPDQQLGAVIQICSAVAPFIPVVDCLALKLSDHYEPSWFRNPFKVDDSALWHGFLQLFGGVRTLRVDKALAWSLTDALRRDNEPVVKELFPMLSEITVMSKKDPSHTPLALFVSDCCLAGQPITLHFTERHPTHILLPPPISWTFNTFEER